MATIDTYDATKTQEIIDNTVVTGSVNGSGDLILSQRNNATINAGSVKAPVGDQGPERPLNAGRITLYAGATAPRGWMFCDGAAVSRVNFPDLFTAIGTKYGAGDGTTTFNLPNLKGKVPVGLDSTQTEFDTLGKQSGAKTHTLATTELPAHTHTVLGYSGFDDKNFTGNLGRINAADTYGQGTTTYDKPTGSTGGGAAHNNLQPFGVLNYIIAMGTAGNQGGGIAAPRYFTTTERGTTAQRDAKYGVPGTSAARVALANSNIVWFNTDLGWNESYYEVTASAGLTVVGLVTGATPGWYPIGEGPYIALEAPVKIATTFNTMIAGFTDMRRKGGASSFTTTGNSLIQVLRHGRYDIKMWTQIREGSAWPDFVLQVLGSNGTTFIKGVSGGAFPQSAIYWSHPHLELYDVEIAAGNQVGVKLQPGTMGGTAMDVHNCDVKGIGGTLHVRYLGPPLVAL